MEGIRTVGKSTWSGLGVRDFTQARSCNACGDLNLPHMIAVRSRLRATDVKDHQGVLVR